ncbi:polymeric immunoglobulin receptor [Strigops habroptila]|uniref:polymeric immunoglobulin receptor n=1 Tax=Strigops habroptila TaxID=2489341 RepID=UPI0011CF097C|nr:polymeric immunoglobulin receptor [Strigops habroptila]XP_030329419.1 polymeric immunoglobulin receptor [Strigops habroptila]XP_030329420.1 polymeric immunoglobulin receptor [Strigops habroptila]
MISLAFILLLTFLPAESARSKYPPKASISSPVFGPRQVYGLLNGSAAVTCFYPPSRVNRHDRKYWCKESATSCLTVASTSGYTAPGYRGRASIIDNPQEENFQISISELTMADAGTYQCGVGVNNRRLSHKVNLDVSEGSHTPEGAELFYVKLDSTVTMTCSFGSDYESTRKFLCKMSKTGCVNIIDSYGNIDEDYTGRALLSNMKDPGSFSIMITQMGWEDSGLYLCGAGVYGESGETKQLDVHVYEETKDPQGKPTIFGVKGSSATVECHYKTLRQSSVNYWCKWRQNGCYKIIDNAGYVSSLYEGRVAMYDSPDNQTITIILNQLKDTDEGYYWCMTDEEEEQQSSTELKIVDGEPGLQGKEEVEAQEGSQLNLTCSYPCRYYSYQKYWCKWSSTSCTPMPASDQRQQGPDVTCDTDDKTVILSFDSVAKTDQGWYWCGVQRNGVYGETMAVYLSVTAGGSDSRSLESLDADVPSPAESGFIPQERANDAASESPKQSGPNTLLLVLAPFGAVLLIVATAFAVFKHRQLKRSDLVSVGSYRTNISMSDFESVKDYGASNNACVKETQETQIGGDELITTAATLESAAETKKAKRSSKEDADLTYSAFLLTSSSIVQGSSGGDAAAPDVPPQI